jgi:GNAT superfamily N-acetyltransferase
MIKLVDILKEAQQSNIDDAITAINNLVLPNSVYVNVGKEHVKGLETIEIKEISVWSSQQGKGLATQALQNITKIADDKNVILSLEAMPIYNKEVSTDKLVDFYKKFGFKIHKSGENPLMIRMPLK